MHVRLFAALRERAGTGTLDLDLADGATVGDVWPQLGLGDEPSGLLYARNRTYVDRSETLTPGDEIAVIPPVSGGDFRLSGDPLSVDTAVAEVRDDERGRDRDVHRHDARSFAWPRRALSRVRGVRGDGRAGHGGPRGSARRSARAEQGVDPPSRRPGRHRRDERGHRRVRTPSWLRRSLRARKRSTS